VQLQQQKRGVKEMTTKTNWKESISNRLQEMELKAEVKRDKAGAEIEEITGISDPITFNRLRFLFGTWEKQDEEATKYGERLANL
jgi:hypothetical protein